MSEKMKIDLKVNGEDVTYEINPEDSLLKALRANYNYDVKNGCAIGECGACTVLFDGEPVKSCVTLAAAAAGHEIWTDKGLGEQDKLSRRLQDAFVECGSVQCGFCIPGFIVAGVGYLKNVGTPDRKMIRNYVSGNLCRCTGYVKIIDAIEKVALEMERGEI